MPDPYDKKFLHFKGKDIDSFLSKYEHYVDQACLTEVRRCESLWMYFSKKERRYLDILKGYQSCNWSQLKDEVWPSYTLLIYPAPLLLYSEEIESKPEQDLSSEPKEKSSSFSVEPQSQGIPESVSSQSLWESHTTTSAIVMQPCSSCSWGFATWIQVIK